METDTRSIYVGNVDYGATAEELKQHFNGCGSINRVTIQYDEFSGCHKGFAFIEFADTDSVATSLTFHDSWFRGRRIKVFAKRTNRPGNSQTNRSRGSCRGRGRGGFYGENDSSPTAIGMFQSPVNNLLSQKLSDVLEDIGVSWRMVIRRRRLFQLMESIANVTYRSVDDKGSAYFLGSQSEGTTSLGLDSDADMLYIDNAYNVMQDLSEWEQNKINLLMVQDENVTPGYCFLQLFRPDLPLNETNILPNEHYIRYSNGRILLKNTFVKGLREDAEQNGPANAVRGNEDLGDADMLVAFPCNSWPQSAPSFFTRQGICRWLSPELIRCASSNGCFVVGTCSKKTTFQELEWRISTTLIERCLIFNLNATQLHCYFLMKIILKTSLNPLKENGMSSYICKTVLLHCIEKTESNIWSRMNLLNCLTYCLRELHRCVENDSCPHFVIPENNLMAGKFTAEVKLELLRKINDVIQDESRYLLRICIDHIGRRLLVKLNTNDRLSYDFRTSDQIYGLLSGLLYFNLATYVSRYQLQAFRKLSNNHIEQFSQIVFKLTCSSFSGNMFDQLACRFLLPLFNSTFGSILVSYSIGQINPVSPEALTRLSLGLNSDATSGRLKLASVFYCTGHMQIAEFLLRQTERIYQSGFIEAVCSCWATPFGNMSEEFQRICSVENEDCIRLTVSFCVRFLGSEVNCVPHELQYEMMRSTQDDMPHRTRNDNLWMDFAVVDSLPFLYFLQYKTYDYLRKNQEKRRALDNLARSIETAANLGHRETALNLLGQCMEQENKRAEAIQFYLFSLRKRARHNAAKIHICNLLAKYASDT